MRHKYLCVDRSTGRKNQHHYRSAPAAAPAPLAAAPVTPAAPVAPAAPPAAAPAAASSAAATAPEEALWPGGVGERFGGASHEAGRR